LIERLRRAASDKAPRRAGRAPRSDDEKSR
jgi:hypothetical protein